MARVGNFPADVLVNIIVNMSQMSALVEGIYGTAGMLPPARAKVSQASIAGHAGRYGHHALGGGRRRIQARREDHDGALIVILVSFLIVAIKGLMDWATWPALAKGLVPTVPPDLPSSATRQVRSGFTQILAIAGQALPPSVMLAYGYLAANAGQEAALRRRSERPCRTSALSGDCSR